MTCARVRGSQRIWSKGSIVYIVGVTENWHAKMCFLGVRIYISMLYKLSLMCSVGNLEKVIQMFFWW